MTDDCTAAIGVVKVLSKAEQQLCPHAWAYAPHHSKAACIICGTWRPMTDEEMARWALKEEWE